MPTWQKLNNNRFSKTRKNTLPLVKSWFHFPKFSSPPILLFFSSLKPIELVLFLVKYFTCCLDFEFPHPQMYLKINTNNLHRHTWWRTTLYSINAWVTPYYNTIHINFLRIYMYICKTNIPLNAKQGFSIPTISSKHHNNTTKLT